MKVAFPYMGPVIAYRKLFELLGYQIITPPRPTKRTIELGAKNSPEFACFPFKVLMGSYIEACELGADLIVSSGGHGPCRAGFYGEIHQRNLTNLGYNVEMIIFDEPMYNLRRFVRNVWKLKGSNSLRKVYQALRLTYRTIKSLDRYDKIIHKITPYEVKEGSAEQVWQKIEQEIDNVYSFADLEKAINNCNDLIESFKLKPANEEERIKVGIIGEIYVVLEPAVNMDIERVLNQLGCETERSHYLSEWIENMLIPGKGQEEQTILKKAEKYIDIIIGGHAKQNIGHIIDYKQQGFDGIVHLKPFACLPELVSESIIPVVSRDYHIPILTLSFDEQTGLANNLTRIEAFIDLIKRIKAAKYSA